jgi:hypothetical protein
MIHLLTLAELSRELDTPPEAIRQMAREEQLPFSFTTMHGFVVHRRDLAAWRRAVARESSG